VHKTFVYHLVAPPPFAWYQPQGVFQACWRNELVSLQKRHLLFEQEPEPEEWRRCFAIAQVLVGELVGARVATDEEVVEHKGAPAARRRYTDAFTRYNGGGPSPTWDRVSAFVKVEKWPEESLSIKPPRLIQFRSYQYCGVLAKFMLPIEEQMWKWKDSGFCPFMKGLNSFETASRLREAWAQFDRPVAVLADHSKFDSCVTKMWKRWLQATFGTASDELVGLYEIQMRNRCYTKGGIRYWCEGREMSGEYTTSVDANIINWALLKDAYRHVLMKGKKVIVFVNGDDSVVFMEADDYEPLGPGDWRRYGFKTTVETVFEFEEIDFCQSKPVEVRPGIWRMVRSPYRAISRGSVSVKRYEGKAWYSLAASVGMSELACGDGVPMMQSWATYLLRCSMGAPPLKAEMSRRARLERRVGEPREVTPTARESFSRAFGISISDQLDFERWCDLQSGSGLDVLPAVRPDDRDLIA